MQRLQNEVDNTSKMRNLLLIVEHQNIVKFEDLIESPNNIYFFMEYCSGGTLEKLIQTKKRLSQNEALPYFRQLAAGKRLPPIQAASTSTRRTSSTATSSPRISSSPRT